MANLIDKIEFDELKHEVEVNRKMIKSLSRQLDFVKGRVKSHAIVLGLEKKLSQSELNKSLDKATGKNQPKLDGKKRGPRKNP